MTSESGQLADLANPRMSVDARRQLTEPSEGLRLKAYRDCVGIWTNGYGHTGRAGGPPVRPGDVWTQAYAEQVLAADLRVFERGVATALKDARFPVLQREFDALVDLAFNIGLGAFKSSSLLRAYLAGDKARVAEKFLDWNQAGGKVIPGLVVRRKRERAWFIDGRLGARTTTVGLVDDIPPNGEAMAREVDHPDAPTADEPERNGVVKSVFWVGVIAVLLIAAGLLVAGCAKCPPGHWSCGFN